MSVIPPVTLDLDSLLLTAGLFTFCIGFALEWVRTRETTHGYARTSLALSVACGLLFVGSGTNLIPTTTVATYTLVGLQIGAVALLFPVLRQWFSTTPPTPP